VSLASAAPAAGDVTRRCDQIPSSMLVQVHGVRSGSGMLVAVLYGDKPELFLKKGARVARERAPARPGSVALCLEAPGPGSYAVAVYHDENDNRRFDRAWTGLPTEGFGVSNNPRPVLRPPTYGESAIQVGPGHRIVNIDLRY
jgi:uncharacterized protein (DUF2141 family)